MKNLINSLVIIFTIFLTNSAFSQAPYKSPLQGTVEQQGLFVHGGCKAYSLSAKYRLSTLVGEPAIFFNIKWQAGRNVSSDCLKNEFVEFWLKIYSGYGHGYFYIPLNGAMGLVPDGNNTWGYNPLSGSPSWAKLFIKDPPTKNPNNNNKWNFVSAERAKTIWKWGFQFTDIVLIDQAGNEYYLSRAF